jgi:murein DD-endopeptidase MepM/ murein hydrolase activator NlpD
MSRLFRGGIAVACAAAMIIAPSPAHARELLSPPTDAPVLDPYRPPDGPYGAGNRGLEYAVGPGAPIRAAADGVVAFAGSVAGARFVSIDHPGGLRTTYGYVGTVLVTEGRRVARGDNVAVAAGPFHFTVRVDGAYRDPADWLGQPHVRLRLIPHGAATLLDGPSGPRTIPGWDRRNHWVRASPGRLGVWHGHTTGKESPWQSSP